MTSTSRWKNSDRKQRLPANWNSLRKQVLDRDSRRCKLEFFGCIGTATEVDHIVAGDEHSLWNLQAVCKDCHKEKSSKEGIREYQRLRKMRFRKQEKHPGLRKA